MAGPEILREIVVKISDDRKKIRGTGFFISETDIATCYHFLKDKNGQLSESYFVKNDAWGDWIRVMPLKEKCSAPQDIALLKCPVPIKLGLGRTPFARFSLKRNDLSLDLSMKLGLKRIPFAHWDGKSKEFRSRGYDCSTTDDEGASTIEGKDCTIIDYTARKGEPRLQLSTIKKTLLPGRSGSPVWSVDQKAIVGIIDYQAGDENIWMDRSMAIPIEVVIPKTMLCAGKSSGRLVKVPELPPNFLLRSDDLDTVKKVLLVDAGPSTAITAELSKVGLYGMGGIGKSVLAAAVARDEEIRCRFYDGIFWLTLGTDPKMVIRRQSDLAEMLDISHVFEDVEQGWTYLSKHLGNKACLIVLDDVWRADDVKALFSDLGPQCRILVTTRDAGIIKALGAREYRMGLLNHDEALDLLARWVEIDVAALPPDASKIVSECGRLPLALALCGAQLNDGVPWKDLVEALQEAELQFLDHPHGSVMKSIKVSVDNLPYEQAECYCELAVFPPDEPVQEAAILTLWTNANNLKERDARKIVSELERKALLIKSGKEEGSTVELHDLQHDYLRGVCQDVQRLHELLLNAYSKKTSQGKWHTGPNDGYFFQHLAYHLLNSGREAELKELALDLRWLEARIEKTDITSLISDFDLLPEDEELRLCRDGLRLSSHVLSRDSSQLAGQLMGRMLQITSPGIEGLMKQISVDKNRPRLRPMTASFTSPGGPLIRTLEGHASSVWAVALTPDGRRALSGSGDKTLKVWDLESGREMRTLEGHAGGVRAVALTPDGRRAVSASIDKTLKVWDLESGREMRTLEGHAGGVYAVALTPDGRRAVSASDDKRSRSGIWKVARRCEL